MSYSGILPSPVIKCAWHHTNKRTTNKLFTLVSQRGVVFFRKQDELDDNLQKELIQRLGLLTGKPSTSSLHVHPIHNARREHAAKDDEISVITSRDNEKLYRDRYSKITQSGRKQWHSDITFEPIPSDYTVLRLTELPKTGGGKSSHLDLRE